MIPKRIFYVWGVGEKKPRDVQVCIQTWRQAMPDYEIIEINQDSKDYFNFAENLKTNKFFRIMYENRLWAFIADYIRIKVLLDNGGIYLDTDVSVIKSLDKFLTEPAFVGLQNSEYTEPAILGAEKGNKFLKDIFYFYENDFWSSPLYTIPQIFKYFLQRNYGIDKFPAKADQQIVNTKDITIYPQKYFIPFSGSEVFTPSCITKETYTIHWFSGSWVKESVIYFMENKHLVKDIKIDRTKDIISIVRYGILNKTIIKIIKTPINTTIKILKIPVIKIKSGSVLLFGFIPILKQKL